MEPFPLETRLEPLTAAYEKCSAKSDPPSLAQPHDPTHIAFHELCDQIFRAPIDRVDLALVKLSKSIHDGVCKVLLGRSRFLSCHTVLFLSSC